MVRRFLGILITLAILGVITNDTVRYGTTQARLRNTTYDLANWAGMNAGELTREEAAVELARRAQPHGVVVYQYGQTDRGAQVWTRAEVTGTVVLARIMKMLDKEASSEATDTSFTVRDYREAGFK